jgi:hypothetical protein
MPDQQSNSGGLDTLVVDPQFAALKPPDMRKALSGVSGDNSFNSLSDDDTAKYVNAHRATLPSAGQNLKAGTLSESDAAVNRPIAPQPLAPKGALPRQGFKENVVEPVEDAALGMLKPAGMVAGAAIGGASGLETGPGALATGVAGAAGGSAIAGGIERRIRERGVAGHLPEIPPTFAREALNTLRDAKEGAEGEMGGRIIGNVAERALPFVKNALASPEKAGKLIERGVAPSGLAAEDQAALRENIGRSSRYIAPETKGFPVQGGEGGAMRTAGIYHRAGDNLWNGTIEPVVDFFKDVQRPGTNVSNAIREGFTDLDKQTKPAAVNAGEQLAQFFERRPFSVGEMADLVKQLNNDRGVARFYDMSPNEQAAAELADPSLRSKVRAVSALRETMFDAIGDTGGEQLGQQFREARKDWGAIRSMEDEMRRARVPTPQPFMQRVMSTLRGSISPRSADFWMRPQETLFNLNNPNRLLPKAASMLGRTDLEAPMMDVRGGRTAPRAQLGTGPIIPPAPVSSSGPVNLGQPEVQPLAENRQLPAVGRTTGPRTTAGPSQFGVSLPEKTPRPLVGPERQLPQSASPTRPEVPLSKNKVWQKPPNLQLPESSLTNPRAALDAAKQEMDAATDMWRQFERPGRYVINANERMNVNGADKPDLQAYGIKSMRGQMEHAFPWLNDLPMMTPSRMEAALKKGSGIDYDRMMRAALDHLRKQK